MQVMFEACISGAGRELASFAQFYSIFYLSLSLMIVFIQSPLLSSIPSPRSKQPVYTAFSACANMTANGRTASAGSSLVA